jgi:hypothetical protein
VANVLDCRGGTLVALDRRTIRLCAPAWSTVH